MQQTTHLANYNNEGYQPGSFLKRLAWMLVSGIFFKTSIFPFYGLKSFLLRIFGAQIGKALVIKPNVHIKYPWFLQIGDHCWIGEGVWIDNLGTVKLGNNVCISQGAMLLCGNHNYTEPCFNLMVKNIIIENGVWIGAKAIVTPGVTAGSHAVLTVGSVATKSLEPYGIYQGNPALLVKTRLLKG
ncbi:MAG: WcaF family extracellular polysaccharide biosynthesis acetyltransferase [Ferruginibacter sp.]